MSKPVDVTYGLPHHTQDCCGGWAQELHGRRMYWRCSGCSAICYDAPGVLEAITTEHVMGATLERLARAGEEMIGEDWPPEGWER